MLAPGVASILYSIRVIIFSRTQRELLPIRQICRTGIHHIIQFTGTQFGKYVGRVHPRVPKHVAFIWPEIDPLKTLRGGHEYVATVPYGKLPALPTK